MPAIRVLWADDQLDVAATLSRLMPSEAEITYVPDGNAAMDAIIRDSYDLVILDLAMPPGDWGGLWVLEQLASRGIEIPIMVLSSEGSQTETIKAMRLGADYVRKEDAAIELAERVRMIGATSRPPFGSPASPPSVAELVAQMETSTVEFKSSARYSYKTGVPEAVINDGVIKTVAAFLNTGGGVLGIGVGDNGEVLGIQPDLDLKRQDLDSYVNWLSTLLHGALGAAAMNTRIRLELVEDKTVCLIDVQPSIKPVYAKTSKGDGVFYVRFNNSTRQLSTPEAVDYVAQHWSPGSTRALTPVQGVRAEPDKPDPDTADDSS